MRATLSFGLAGILAAAGFLFYPAMPFGFPLGGIAAALLIRRKTASARQRITATIITTLSFGLTGLIVVFSLISMQAQVEPIWGALAWGFGFGAGGALSGPWLSRLWIPSSARPDHVSFAALIAGLTFSFSGAVAGYLGFQGFLVLGFYALSLCVLLAYLLGGLLCERAWQRSLVRCEMRLEVVSIQFSQYERQPAVPVSDADRRARNSLIWAVVALFLLVFLVMKVRWPLPLIDIVLLLLWFAPLLMLGVREVSDQVVILLMILSTPAIFWGVSALLAMRREPDRKQGKSGRMAVFGTSTGALLLIAGLLLLSSPVARLFDSLYGRLLIASARHSDSWDAGNRIHQGNTLLGRSALRSGQIQEARHCLLAAGHTPGSPQLNTFGPTMSFAKEMLEAGEREPVLEYLDLCRSFWKADEGRLDRWKQEIKAGRTPDFGTQL